MNIKDKIGERILTERKAQGLTRKALAELTNDLKQSRINNWERGYRTPGPAEIQQLARALNVSAAFLMCLTDDKESDKQKKIPGLGALIPILDSKQINDPKLHIEAIKEEHNSEKITFIPVNPEIADMISEYSFAFHVNDNSMEPELLNNDILIIDPILLPKPGNFVIAKVEGSDEVVVRRYKQLSASVTMQKFELLATNSHWASLQNNEEMKCTLLGTVVYINRKCV